MVTQAPLAFNSNTFSQSQHSPRARESTSVRLHWGRLAMLFGCAAFHAAWILAAASLLS